VIVNVRRRRNSPSRIQKFGTQLLGEPLCNTLAGGGPAAGPELPPRARDDDHGRRRLRPIERRLVTVGRVSASWLMWGTRIRGNIRRRAGGVLAVEHLRTFAVGDRDVHDLPVDAGGPPYKTFSLERPTDLVDLLMGFDARRRSDLAVGQARRRNDRPQDPLAIHRHGATLRHRCTAALWVLVSVAYWPLGEDYPPHLRDAWPAGSGTSCSQTGVRGHRTSATSAPYSRRWL
jgi:hypothetical protein